MIDIFFLFRLKPLERLSNIPSAKAGGNSSAIHKTLLSVRYQ